MKAKPVKAWAVMDRKGKYAPEVFWTRREAIDRRQLEWDSLIDARGVVVPVEIRELPKTRKKEGR